MAHYKSDIVDIDLNSGKIHRNFLIRTIGHKDDDADRFGVRVFRNGVAEDLTGVSCQAIFMAPDGQNIALTSYGTISGNEAYVTLPQACYNVEGQFCLAIKLVGGGVTATVRIIDGVVDRTGATGAVAPTEAVPTYQEILAVYAQMQEDIADYESVVANQNDQINSLKSALTTSVGFETLFHTQTNKYINGSKEFVSSNDWYSGLFSCSEGDVFHLTTVGGATPRAYFFYNNNGESIESADSGANLKYQKVVAPSGTAYIGINANKSYPYYWVVEKKTQNPLYDYIDNLNCHDDTGTVVNGYINKSTGELNTDGSGTYKRSGYVEVYDNCSYYFSGYVTSSFSGVAAYNSSKTFIENIIAPSASTDYKNQKLTLPSGTKYIAVCSQSKNPVLIEEIALPPFVKGEREDIDDLLSDVGNTQANIQGAIVDGYIKKATGELTTTGGGLFRRSGYILVDSGNDYYFSGYVAENFAGVAAYSENKTWLGNIIAPDTAKSYTNQKLTLIEGTVYIVVCAQTNDPTLTEVMTVSSYARTNRKHISSILPDVSELKSEVSALSNMKPTDLTCVSVFEKIGVCGDSYSSGGIYGVTGMTDGMYKNVSWPAIFGRRNGIDCKTFSSAGATTETWQTKSDCQPLMLSSAKCNLYIIMLGINDSDDNIGTIADVNDSDPSQNANTMYGNYAKIYHTIHDYAPAAKFIFVIPPMTSGQRQTCISTLATRYGVPCFKIFTDELFESSFYTDNISNYHPIAVTYAGMAVAFERQITKCIVDNVAYFKNYTGVIPE